MASNKRYRCIYCGKMYTREDLVRHLESKHLDELPDTFTPLRVAYHIANKKDFKYRRKCRICKADTSWDEKKGRYNQLCDKPECHRKQANQMYLDMKDRRGINAQTKTPEGLEKMLAGRRISGQYKWHNGTIYSYTGTYEKAALEFMDKIMEIKSEDLQVPGPVCTYILDGKEHYYIPDMYYVPYNLIIEVKDGGDRGRNENKNYAETRRRQIAKEEHIIKNTNYNYVRLTDKDMSQLLVIFSQLKMELVDGTNERVVRVNEAADDADMSIKVCPKCGGKIITIIAGEPIRKCEDCGYYIGVVPFPKNKATKIIPKSNIITERGMIKSNKQLLKEAIDILDDILGDTDYSMLEQTIHKETLLESDSNPDTKTVNSYIIKLYQHLIKYQYQRVKQSYSWFETCINSSKVIHIGLANNNIRNNVLDPNHLQSLYNKGLKEANKETKEKYDHGYPPEIIPDLYLNLDILTDETELICNLIEITESYYAEKDLKKRGYYNKYEDIKYNRRTKWFE